VHGNALRLNYALPRYFPEEIMEFHEYEPINPPGFETSTFLIQVWSVTATPARSIYRDIYKAVDEFTAPRFSTTGILSTARCMGVLSMTQHA
jgi:hypothetical protein